MRMRREYRVRLAHQIKYPRHSARAGEKPRVFIARDRLSNAPHPTPLALARHYNGPRAASGSEGGAASRNGSGLGGGDVGVRVLLQQQPLSLEPTRRLGDQPDIGGMVLVTLLQRQARVTRGEPCGFRCLEG
jgi:hypothetical protein